jgi:hypothetical protein
MNGQRHGTVAPAPSAVKHRGANVFPLVKKSQLTDHVLHGIHVTSAVQLSLERQRRKSAELYWRRVYPMAPHMKRSSLAPPSCLSRLERAQTGGPVPACLVVVALATFILVAGPPLASAAFVSHWQGEGNLLDSVGSNHGISSGQIGYEPGIVGQAIRFPDDGYIDIPSPVAGGLVSPSGFTVATWIRIDGADPPPGGGPGAIVSYGTSAVDNGFAIEMGGSNVVVFRLSTGPSPSVLFSDLLTWGQYYHLAATFDAATHTAVFYRNGDVVASRNDLPGTNLVTQPGAIFQIGRSIPLGSTFDGALDDVRFYNSALSQSEIRSLVPEPASGAFVLFGIIGLRLLSRRSFPVAGDQTEISP